MSVVGHPIKLTLGDVYGVKLPVDSVGRERVLDGSIDDSGRPATLQ